MLDNAMPASPTVQLATDNRGCHKGNIGDHTQWHQVCYTGRLHHDGWGCHQTSWTRSNCIPQRRKPAQAVKVEPLLWKVLRNLNKWYVLVLDLMIEVSNVFLFVFIYRLESKKSKSWRNLLSNFTGDILSRALDHGGLAGEECTGSGGFQWQSHGLREHSGCSTERINWSQHSDVTGLGWSLRIWKQLHSLDRMRQDWSGHYLVVSDVDGWRKVRSFVSVCRSVLVSLNTGGLAAVLYPDFNHVQRTDGQGREKLLRKQDPGHMEDSDRQVFALFPRFCEKL